MDATNPRCIIHVERNTTETLKVVDDNAWQRLKEADRKRRSWLRSSKFHNIHLPDYYDPSMCYHTSCYKDFTAVPKIVEDDAPHVDSHREHTRVHRTDLLLALLVCTNLFVFSVEWYLSIVQDDH